MRRKLMVAPLRRIGRSLLVRRHHHFLWFLPFHIERNGAVARISAVPLRVPKRTEIQRRVFPAVDVHDVVAAEFFDGALGVKIEEPPLVAVEGALLHRDPIAFPRHSQIRTPLHFVGVLVERELPKIMGVFAIIALRTVSVAQEALRMMEIEDVGAGRGRIVFLVQSAAIVLVVPSHAIHPLRTRSAFGTLLQFTQSVELRNVDPPLFVLSRHLSTPPVERERGFVIIGWGPLLVLPLLRLLRAMVRGTEWLLLLLLLLLMLWWLVLRWLALLWLVLLWLVLLARILRALLFLFGDPFRILIG